MVNRELYHHGIKGQRWGIRRYQNKDGTLTNDGQKRYLKEQYIRKAVGEYSRQYNKASRMSDEADAKWSEAKALYAKTGKNAVTRILNNIRNKTAITEEYSKVYNEASNMSDKADAEWQKVWELRRKTGKNAISRIINNVKYSQNE